MKSSRSMTSLAQTPTSWALNECFSLNIFLMSPSSVSRFLVLITLTLSVWLSKLPLSVLCFLLQSQINDLFGNLMSRMLSLNGTFLELVHVEPPPGYIDPRVSTHVCRLKKAFYGLKQSHLVSMF